MPWHANSLDEAFRNQKLASERQHGRGMLSLRADAITNALAADLANSGISESTINISQAATQTAGYRTRAHQWDLVVVRGGVPEVVIDWKTLSGSNNINNRLDELVATSTSLRMSFDKTGASGYRPLLAMLYIVDQRFPGPGTRNSIEIFVDRLRKMLSDKLLDCACVLYFDPDRQQLIDFDSDLGFDQFATKIGSPLRAAATSNALTTDSSIDLGRLLSAGDVAGVVTGLASTSAGLSAVEAAVIASRRQVIADLQALAVDSDTNETVMHRAIADNYWIFGGQYVGIAPRRDFALLDEHDYPLLCADGSVHIVELKGPGCALVRKYRNHYIVTNDVHEATSQCLNYIRSLDEQGPILEVAYRNELGIDIDFRRAKGTVVIGHIERKEVAHHAQKFQVVQAIRSYNAHLSRIQVITYSDLLDAADRTLRFESLMERGLNSGGD